MAIFDTTEEHFWRNIVTHAVLILITVTIIVMFLPKDKNTQYTYEVGKPWMYNSLMAKFDFPIYKDDATLKREQDSIMDLYEPYFDFDATVEKKNVEKFLSDYSNGIEGLPKSFIYTIAERLNYVYEHGVMTALAYTEFATDTTARIMVINGNEASSRPINTVFSAVKAYEQLFLDEAIAAQRPLLQKCNLNEYIEANLVYNKEKSNASKEDLLSSIPTASGVVLSGQKIIDRGEIVTPQTYRIIESLQKETEKRTGNKSDYYITTAGQALYVFILLSLFTIYLLLFRRSYISTPRSIMMLYALILVFEILVSLMMSHMYFCVYILPFAMVPIYVGVFLDSRTAFISHVVLILICACAVREQFDFIVVEIVAGLVAIYTLRELSSRSQLFKTAVVVTAASLVTYFALDMMREGDVSKIDRSMYVYFIVNGILLLFAYPGMYLVERLFGLTSNVTLIELSNTNNELLRQMSEVASGTFQHSIQVSNLAAEIANKIGAKSQLVRTGALYHDIGKMSNPAYFTENQKGGVSPHEKLSCMESAKMVISHVSAGIKMAEKNNLPNVIKDFILTHHGKGVARYFYITYKNEHPDEEVDITPFQYPGPNPFTKEQAILMMTDAVEAASRSMKTYTEESIHDLVNHIIDGQMKEGFFQDCPITFHDVEVAKKVLIGKLMTIYHTRISYPSLSKEVQEAEDKAEEEAEQKIEEEIGGAMEKTETTGKTEEGDSSAEKAESK